MIERWPDRSSFEAIALSNKLQVDLIAMTTHYMGGVVSRETLQNKSMNIVTRTVHTHVAGTAFVPL